MAVATGVEISRRLSPAPYDARNHGVTENPVTFEFRVSVFPCIVRDVPAFLIDERHKASRPRDIAGIVSRIRFEQQLLFRGYAAEHNGQRHDDQR